MLEQILNLIQQHGQQTVVDNPEVPNNYNNQVLSEASTAITQGFQNSASSGGLQNIISLFTGQNQSQGNNILSNPLVSSIVASLAGKLVNNLNINPATANNVANSLIPNVINSLVSKTKSNAPENDSFDLNDLIASFTGGNAAADNSQSNGFDFQGLLNQFTGGGQSNIGHRDLNGVLSQLTEKAQGHQNNEQQTGGIANLIAGFFK